MKKQNEIMIDLNSRDFLIALREEAETCANIKGTNPSWVRAFLKLADATDHLDAMRARCTIHEETYNLNNENN
jgi:hypothetical protein